MEFPQYLLWDGIHRFSLDFPQKGPVRLKSVPCPGIITYNAIFRLHPAWREHSSVGTILAPSVSICSQFGKMFGYRVHILARPALKHALQPSWCAIVLAYSNVRLAIFLSLVGQSVKLYQYKMSTRCSFPPSTTHRYNPLNIMIMCELLVCMSNIDRYTATLSNEALEKFGINDQDT